MLQNNMCNVKHPFDCIVGAEGDGCGMDPTPLPPPCRGLPTRLPGSKRRSAKGGACGGPPFRLADVRQKECGKTEEHTGRPCSVNHPSGTTRVVERRWGAWGGLQRRHRAASAAEDGRGAAVGGGGRGTVWKTVKKMWKNHMFISILWIWSSHENKICSW